MAARGWPYWRKRGVTSARRDRSWMSSGLPEALVLSTDLRRCVRKARTDVSLTGQTLGIITALLEQALKEVASLPEKDQERIAALILDEISSDRRWEESFRRSEDVLGQLADEALSERRAGKTRLLDPEQV